MDESQLYHVVHGPFTFKQEELNKDEGKWSVTGRLAVGQELCQVLSTFSANQDWFSMITDQPRNRGRTGQLVERGR